MFFVHFNRVVLVILYTAEYLRTSNVNDLNKRRQNGGEKDIHKEEEREEGEEEEEEGGYMKDIII